MSDGTAAAVVGAVGTAIAVAGCWAGALTLGGLAAALALGLAVLLLGGPPWALLLLAFFITASLLTRFAKGRKAPLHPRHRRDAIQVLANGGWGCLLALATLWLANPLPFAAFTGAMAAVTADTWATELGMLSCGRPRLVTTGQHVEPGTSGAVSSLGLLASAGGGILVGGLAWLLMGPQPTNALPWLVLGLAAGFLGSLVDSYLGATCQALYRCPSCQRQTEQAVHGCRAAGALERGWPWLNNDAVNFATSVAGSAVGLALYLLGRF